jgi:hypothetical protein
MGEATRAGGLPLLFFSHKKSLAGIAQARPLSPKNQIKLSFLLHVGDWLIGDWLIG